MIKIKIKGARRSGKTTIADIIKNALQRHGFRVELEDADESYVTSNNADIIRGITKRQPIAIKVVNKIQEN